MKVYIDYKIIIIGIFSFIFLSSFNNYGIGTKKINENYDLIIIGGGMAAYSAAHAANKLGKKTLLIHDNKEIGGITINIGAIPTKHLVKVANEIRNASNVNFEGIKTKKIHLSTQKILKGKNKIIEKARKLRYKYTLDSMNNVKTIIGFAKFIDSETIIVNNKLYSGKYYLIATGSKTKIPYIKGIENCKYLTIKKACNLNPKIKSITIIGAGYLGLELGMVYSQLGVKVRILERAERVLKNEMQDVSEVLEKSLKRDKIELLKNFTINEIKQKGKKIEIIGRQNKRMVKIIEKGEIFLATGITGNTLDLNLETANIKTGRKNMIKTNDYMQTSNNKVYAAGDCVDSPCFVCVADMEARIAIKNMFDKKCKINYQYYPWVTFTQPQVAGAGYDERQAKLKKIPYESKFIKLQELPYSLISNEKEGFIKLIRNKYSGIIVGARIICNNAGEIISFISFLIKNKMHSSALVNNLYPYLTCSEGLKNTAISFDKKNLSCCIP